MSLRDRIVCQCGGEIPRPIPLHCPHCGAVILGARRRWWSVLLPLAAVIAMFAALVTYVAWLARWW